MDIVESRNHHQTVQGAPKAHDSTQPKKNPIKINPYDVLFTVFVVAWAILATSAGQYLVAYPLSWLLGERLLEPGWTLVYYLLTYIITLAVLVLVPPAVVRCYRKAHQRQINENMMQRIDKDMGSNANSMGVQHLPTFVDIGLAPIAYVVYLFAASLLTRIMTGLFGWFDAGQEQNIGFGYYITGLDRMFAIIAVVLVAPIAEELIMRGWLYGKVRRKWAAPIAALIISVVFGLLHGQWNVGVTTFALSMILCGLREITGTIWSGILLHMLVNGVAFYLLYIAI